MQVKSLKPPNNYQVFLDSQLCLTEQQKPIVNKPQHDFKNAQSEQLPKHNRNELNLRQAIYHQLLIDGQMNERNHRRQIFTRQNYSALSKKQSSIRKKNYHQSPTNSPQKEYQVESQHLHIKQATITRAQSAQSKRPFSSYSHRPLTSSSAKESTQKLWVSRPQISERPLTSTRPQTSASKLSKIKIVQNTQKYFQFRKQNPLVIYPFESHLKIKRIDENPKVLASIITKKNKFMDKQELYEYVSKIMYRRPK